MVDPVVFDTNIWISNLLRRGKSYQAVRLAREGKVKCVYCDTMLAELAEKLRERWSFSENRIYAVVYEIRSISRRVKITGELKVVRADPDDDKFVECALVAGAPIIVSNDHHLLDLGKYQEICVLSATEFVARYQHDE